MKKGIKIGILTLFAVTLIFGFFIEYQLNYFEKQKELLFLFKGMTKFNVEIIFYLLASFLLAIFIFLLLRKSIKKTILSVVFIVVFCGGLYCLGMKGFLSDYYSYFYFNSPMKTEELIIVDESFLHGSKYSLYVKQDKFFIKEIDNAPLYQLTSNFYWSERTYSLGWLDETTVEIRCLEPNEDTIKGRVEFSLK